MFQLWQKFGLLRKHHDDVGHPAYVRCLELLKETYWFPRTGRFVKKYMASCMNHNFSKGDGGCKGGMLHPIDKTGVYHNRRPFLVPACH